MKSADQIAAERANFLLRQAFDEDAQGNEEDATELYLNAAEMCIEAVKYIYMYLSSITCEINFCHLLLRSWSFNSRFYWNLDNVYIHEDN